MFSKSDMIDGKMDFLKSKLSNNFEIKNDDRSKVIFGYNGIGKSNIFNYIKNHSQINDAMFMNYTDDIIKFTSGKAKKLTIKASVIKEEEILSKINTIKSNLKFKETLKKDFGITSKPKARNISDGMEEAYNDNKSKFTIKKKEIDQVNALIIDNHLKPFVVYFNKLSKVSSVSEHLQTYKENMLYNILSIVYDYIDETTNTCPICDSEVEELYKIVQNKQSEIDTEKDNIIKEFQDYGYKINIDELNNMIEATKILSADNTLVDYALCKGNSERLDEITNNLTELKNLENEQNNLKKQQKLFYENLKNKEQDLKNDLISKYELTEDKIIFNNNDLSINITFPREVDKYSTGEINLLLFIIKLYEFLGSDNQTLFLDDPVSSLDIPNLYKIVFELVALQKYNKQVIIFTHTISIINAINSQNSKIFDYYYLEESKGQLYIQKIDISSNKSNILSLTSLKSEKKFNNNILQALIEKENSDFSNEIHKLFHYDGSIYYHEIKDINKKKIDKVCNNDLINLINNFTCLKHVDFIENSIEKIVHIAATRVWIEKKIYDLISHDNNLIKKFKKKKTLGQKINFVFPLNSKPIATVPCKINREKLMRLKVLLNQSSHYQSQVLPFYYALNISLDDLNKEIEIIKNMFT